MKGNTVHRTLTHSPSQGIALIFPALIFLFMITMYPMLNTLFISLTTMKNGSIIFYGMNNYIQLIQDEWFWKSFLNTAIFTAASTIFHLFLGIIFALMLNMSMGSDQLKNVFRGIFILPWVFSTAASALMWLLLMHPFGLFNFIFMDVFMLEKPIEFLSSPVLSMGILIVINTWKYYPFYMISILGALQSVPLSLYEAAKVDGATGWQRFWRITIPQIRGVLIVVSTYDIITTFGHIDFIKMLTKGGPFRTTETISYYIYKAAFLDGKIAYGSTVGIFMLLILILLTYFYLKIVRKEQE